MALFTMIAGYLFDAIGPTAPFSFLGAIDALFVLVFLCFIYLEVRDDDDDKDTRAVIE
jgi:hypothetical protein